LKYDNNSDVFYGTLYVREDRKTWIFEKVDPFYYIECN